MILPMQKLFYFDVMLLKFNMVIRIQISINLIFIAFWKTIYFNFTGLEHCQHSLCIGRNLCVNYHVCEGQHLAPYDVKTVSSMFR